MGEFDARFMKDKELHDLLERWSAPDVPRSLDNRVTAAYNSLMGDAAGRLNSALHPQRDSEVVTMKFCNTCQEQFADRFSFCPVDGTPLSAAPVPSISAPARDIETSYPMAETTVPPPNVSEPAYSEIPASAAVTSAAASGASMIGEYHLTILEDRGLLYRLTSELGGVAHNYQLTWPEFKRDPFGFVKRSIQGYGQMVRGFLGSRDILIAMSFSVVAIAAVIGIISLLDRTSTGSSRKPLIVIALLGFCGLLAIFSTWLRRDRDSGVMGTRPADSRNALSGIIASFVMVFVVIGGLFFWDMRQKAKAAGKGTDEDLELTQMISDIPNAQPTPDEGTAGTNKGTGGGSKPKQEKPGGGGGGGRQEQKPASFGKTPQGSLTVPQVLPPDPRPPKLNPSLPWQATLNVDSPLLKEDTRNLNYGDPKSRSTDISSGPGTGNGIGTGNGTGIGSGDGNGLGPGRGGNTGGGDFKQGGGGPGGGGGGTDYNRVFSGKDVSSKARILEKPEPQYTEPARKNQITGTVVIRAVFSSTGQVTNIVAVSKLPDGLTEKAIAAARQIRFVPATKDGRPVSMYMQLEYNFNLY